MSKIWILAALLVVSGRLHAQPDASEGYRREIQVSPLLRTTTDAAGQKITYPSTQNPEVTAVLVEIPPGAETGWHKHPFPCFGYILSGTLDVEMEGGKVHRLTAGQALAESVNFLHNGVNKGTEPVRLVMFVMGEMGKPFTERVKK